MEGLVLSKGVAIFEEKFENGAVIMFRHCPEPVFMNFAKSCLSDDRSGETDWELVGREVAVWAITGWKNVFEEDRKPAECNEENKRALPTKILSAIFLRSIEHLPKAEGMIPQVPQKEGEGNARPLRKSKKSIKGRTPRR